MQSSPLPPFPLPLVALVLKQGDFDLREIARMRRISQAWNVWISTTRGEEICLLREFSHLNQIQSVVPISRAFVKAMHFDAVRHLTLNCKRLSTQNLCLLASRLPANVAFHLGDDQFVPLLSHLSFRDCGRLTDANFMAFRRCFHPQLQTLDLMGCADLTDASSDLLVQLAGDGNLPIWSLNASFCQFSGDATCRLLAAIPQPLIEIFLEGATCTAVQLGAALARFTNLRTLDISQCPSPVGQVISHLPPGIERHICRCNFSLEAFAELVRYIGGPSGRRLEDIDIGGYANFAQVKIDDPLSLERLVILLRGLDQSSMREVSLTSSLDGAAMAVVAGALPEGVERLELVCPHIDEEGIEIILQRLAYLQYLEIRKAPLPMWEYLSFQQQQHPNMVAVAYCPPDEDVRLVLCSIGDLEPLDHVPCISFAHHQDLSDRDLAVHCRHLPERLDVLDLSETEAGLLTFQALAEGERVITHLRVRGCLALQDPKVWELLCTVVKRPDTQRLWLGRMDLNPAAVVALRGQLEIEWSLPPVLDHPRWCQKPDDLALLIEHAPEDLTHLYINRPFTRLCAVELLAGPASEGKVWALACQRGAQSLQAFNTPLELHKQLVYEGLEICPDPNRGLLPPQPWPPQDVRDREIDLLLGPFDYHAFPPAAVESRELDPHSLLSAVNRPDEEDSFGPEPEPVCWRPVRPIISRCGVDGAVRLGDPQALAVAGWTILAHVNGQREEQRYSTSSHVHSFHHWVVHSHSTQALFSPRQDNAKYQKSFDLLVRAADFGVPLGLAGLGVHLYHGYLAKPDHAKAAALFQRSADEGDAHGQAMLGWCYLTGRGVKKDWAEAGYLFWQSRSLSLGAAGLAWLNHLGALPDKVTIPDSVFYWDNTHDYLKRAYDDGSCPQLEALIGWIQYERAPSNDGSWARMAFCHFRQAAEWGEPLGLSGLGRCYYEGKGIGQDYDKAFACFERAALLGDLRGIKGLAKCYTLARGVDLKPAKALTLLARNSSASASSSNAFF